MKEDKMLRIDVWEGKASDITSVTEYQGEGKLQIQQLSLLKLNN